MSDKNVFDKVMSFDDDFDFLIYSCDKVVVDVVVDNVDVVIEVIFVVVLMWFWLF